VEKHLANRNGQLVERSELVLLPLDQVEAKLFLNPLLCKKNKKVLLTQLFDQNYLVKGIHRVL
jgi:hypothetical protein